MLGLWLGMAHAMFTSGAAEDDLFGDMDKDALGHSGVSDQGCRSRKDSSPPAACSSSSSPSGAVPECEMPTCHDPRRLKGRWCQRHQRHYDNKRYDVEHNPVVNGITLKDWVSRMKDKRYAANVIEQQQQANASVAKWRTSSKQYRDSLWAESHGHRLERAEGDLVFPVEKDQHIIKKMEKFGWDDSDAREHWQRLLSQDWERDWEGKKGQVRLWLPKEHKQLSKTDYENVAAQTNSEVLRDASMADREALRMHVHERSAAMTHSSAFVNGGSGLARPPSPRLEESPRGDEEAGAVVPKDLAGDFAATDLPDRPPKRLKGNIVKLDQLFRSVRHVYREGFARFGQRV